MERWKAIGLLKGLGFEVREVFRDVIWIRREGAYFVSELGHVPCEGFHGWAYDDIGSYSVKGRLPDFNYFYYLSKEDAERDFLNGRGIKIGPSTGWIRFDLGRIDEFLEWTGFDEDSLEGVAELGTIL